MQAYTRFAEVYDTFMDNVPYEEWAEYLVALLKEYGVEDGVIVELGCGTGSMTRILSDYGYDMIGIDNSYEMLEIARDREYDEESYDEECEESVASESLSVDDEECQIRENNNRGNTLHSDSEGIQSHSYSYEEENEENEKDEEDTWVQNDSEFYDDEYDEENYEMPNGILYLEQDMREFELFGTAKAIVSVCDSMNYITTDVDLKKVFTLANNYLEKDGVFIFDMNTEYKYNYLLGDNTIAENRDDCSFIWENYYDKDSMMNEYHVTIYVSATDELEEVKHSEVKLFERFEETHYQKSYAIDTVISLIKEAGMEFVAVYDAFTKDKPTDMSERVYFIAKEKQQPGKVYI